jgi:hypothetical protein
LAGNFRRWRSISKSTAHRNEQAPIQAARDLHQELLKKAAQA